ncbi:MAG: hypothetical protein A2945_04890 [Candidatus Liptonbacteria bacterium RIFCSPLOWO2_01_FULL_52_25]|uniref:Uncharacterized protein n=1 Tax=Candidatus Liptonbacteria bacterium RIFCSPLOWO2_01_FULL_52_25 TaxID=1798650 RepID=A0A1G2CEW3_9BACT|nr:MAG: hypothetical protein A2945_04890 [Candidatus Liptonbacteria bacterium RIFCSPLOWO2_01_FULL_52_25]
MEGSPENSLERNAGGKFSRADFDAESRRKYVLGEINTLERQAEIPDRKLTDEQAEHLENMRKERAELEAAQKKDTGEENGNFEETI